MTVAWRRVRAAGGNVVLAVACVIVAACAQLATTDETGAPPAADAAFGMTGRLSARKGAEAIAANVQWTHSSRGDTLDLATPLGQTLARMSRTPAGVAVDLADGQRRTADSFAALTTAAFGVPIPVEGLAYWIRAVPHPGGPFRGERDTAGRLQTLDQDGWTMAYTYPDDAVQSLPRRVTLAYPDIDLRIVIDAWQ